MLFRGLYRNPFPLKCAPRRDTRCINSTSGRVENQAQFRGRKTLQLSVAEGGSLLRCVGVSLWACPCKCVPMGVSLWMCPYGGRSLFPGGGAVCLCLCSPLGADGLLMFLRGMGVCPKRTLSQPGKHWQMPPLHIYRKRVRGDAGGGLSSAGQDRTCPSFPPAPPCGATRAEQNVECPTCLDLSRLVST